MAANAVIEPLEARQLLAVTWVNRGKADNFGLYRSDAIFARKIVDAALADWSKSLPKLNVKLRISATDLEAGQKSQNALGVADGTTIQLDKDAAGHKWYFDKDVEDNSDLNLARGATPFTARGKFKGADFYSVVLHEIGHALGFTDHATGFRRAVAGGTYSDPHHSNNGDDLMYPFLGTTPVRRLVTPYDIKHTTAGRLIKDPLPARSFFTAAASQGEPMIQLTWNRPGVPGQIRIYRSTRRGPTWRAAGATLLATSTTTQTSLIDSTAAPDTTYYYFVVPVNSSAAGGYAPMAVGSRTAGDPVSTAATPATDGIRLDWTVGPGLTTLTVLRSTTAADSPDAAGATMIARFSPTASSPLPTSWVDPGVAPDTTYHYWLVATYDLGGGKLTNFTSRIATARSLANSAPAVQVTSVADTLYPGVRFHWTRVPGASSYDVYRSTTPAASRAAAGATLFATGITDASQVPGDGTLGWGKGHYYWVVARFGNDSNAPTYEYPLPGRGYILRPTETNTAAASFDKQTIEVTIGRSYGDETGVHHFNIYRSLSYAGSRQASNAQLVGTLDGSAAWDWRLKYYDFAVPADTNVYYWVEAVYQIFPDLTITRELPPFGGIRRPWTTLDFRRSGTVVASKGTARDSIDVTWQPVPGAGGYDIYMGEDTGDYEVSRPAIPAAHVSDPSAGQFTIGSNVFPGDQYAPPGPRDGLAYRIWVVATPGPGLAAPSELGVDRGYTNGMTASKGLPNGILVTWAAPFNTGYGYKIFRSTSPTASPWTGGLEYLANGGPGYLDTTAAPGVTYYYWAFHSSFDSLYSPVWSTDSGYRA